MRGIASRLAIAVAFLLLALGATSASAAAPTITLTTFSPLTLTTSSVKLEAEINPQGKATQYHFEYGLADCSVTPCTSTPSANLAKGESPVKVPPIKVEGLTPATTYHFRVVANNGKTAADSAEGPDRTFTTFSPPQVFDLCPNDAFRNAQPSQSLPDCRAYEQASPLDKDGGDAMGTVPFVRSSPSGEAVTFVSSSGIPGGEGAQELPIYLASRGAGDWSTQGLLPPGESGQDARVIGWTPEFSQVFDMATKFGKPPTTTLLARPSAGGPLATIVPYTANASYAFAGASADGAEAIFESDTKLLPEALTGESNLYVWEKATGKLSLASVLNDGKAFPEGAFAGPYDWVRGTTPATLAAGGAERNYYTQDEHAVAADGSVFFTAAGTGQLYVRRSPSEAQSPLNGSGKCTDPALACTIQVSASRKTNGKGPGNTDVAGSAPAAFVGATADGSAVFFTSSEKLTNEATTGPEPSPPGIARANLDGSSPNFNFLLTHASSVAVDGSHIYWTNPSQGTIGRALIGGGGKEDDFIEGADNPQGIAVDAEHIYWTNAGDGEDGHGSIGRAKLGAIEAEDVEQEFISGAIEKSPGVFDDIVNNPQGIDVDAGHLYWVNAHLNEFGSPDLFASFVARASIDGNPASIEPECIPFATADVAVNASKIYYSRAFGGGGFIRQADLDCSNEENLPAIDSLLDGVKGPLPIALDGSHLYFANPTTSTIGRANLDGSGPEEIVKGAGQPRGLALDAAHIYWSANQETVPNPGNDLYRYEVASGELSDLVVDPADENGAEVQGVLGTSADGSYIYFAANGVLAPGASAGNCHGVLGSASGVCNLYLWQEGEISFIARLDVSGSSDRSDAVNWASTPTGVFPSFTFQKTARLSADGQTLLFRSQHKLSAYENEGTAELYRYRVGEGGPSCVSCNPTGAAPVESPTLGTIETAALVPARPTSLLTRVLSASGKQIFFETTDALAPADTNGAEGCPLVGSLIQSVTFRRCQDVYEWEAEGAGSCQNAAADGGCLYLLSSGQSKEPSFLLDASASGNDAFIFTRSALVGQDQDQLVDVYDARVGGGLAAQNQQPPLICESLEACHRPATPPPVSASPGSASFSGPGNVKGKRPGKGHCPKGKVRRGGKCVKKSGKAKGHRKHSRANHHRRTSQ